MATKALIVPHRISEPMAANVLARAHDIACIDSNGRLIPGAEGTANHAVGVFESEFDNRTTAESGGGAGAITAEALCGQWGDFAITGTAPTLYGYAYISSRNTVSGDAVSGAAAPRGVAGIVIQIRNSRALVLFSPQISQILALIADHEARIAALEAV